MDLLEFGWGGMDWIDLAQNRESYRDFVNSVLNFGVLQTARNFLTS
jgi:hypothetical protein